MDTLHKKVGQLNRISVLFFLVDLCFSYLFIHEIGKLRVMCGIPLKVYYSFSSWSVSYIKSYPLGYL